MEKDIFDYYTNDINDCAAKGTIQNISDIRVAQIGHDIIVFVYNRDVKDINANTVLHFVTKESIEKESVNAEPTKDAQPDTNYTDEPSDTIVQRPKEAPNPTQDLSAMAEQLKRLEDKVDKILAILSANANTLCEEDNKNGC